MRSRPRDGRRPGRALLAAGAVVIVSTAWAGTASAPAAADDTATPAPSYNGTANAGGARVTLQATGVPLFSTIFDGGGPTAISAGDSFGGGQGYAAFPDPSQSVLSLPSLALGLLSSGAAGLPPITIPITVPQYPLSVQSDANTPRQSYGDSAPYGLTATTTDTGTTAHAVAGLTQAAGTTAAVVDAASSVGVTPDGGVLSTASSTVTGFGVGPLTIGAITSTASETMSPTGTITPATDLHISGVKIGGIPIGLDPDALDLAGAQSVALPINATVATILKSAGIGVQVLAPQTYKDTVIAPAVQITMPFSTPYVKQVGSFTGTMTVILGSASAQLKGGPGAGAFSDPPVLTGASGGTVTGGTGTTGPGTTSGSTGSSGTGSTPVDSGSTGGGFVTTPTDTGTGVTAPAVGPAPAVAPTTDGSAQLAASSGPAPMSKQLDLEALYLIILTGALVAGALGVLISRTGLRSWIATRS